MKKRQQSTVNGQQSTVNGFNILGMLVEEIETNSNEPEIKVSDFSAGVYFFNIDSENGTIVKKIVKY